MLNAQTASNGALIITSCMERNGGLILSSNQSGEAALARSGQSLRVGLLAGAANVADITNDDEHRAAFKAIAVRRVHGVSNSSGWGAGLDGHGQQIETLPQIQFAQRFANPGRALA